MFSKCVKLNQDLYVRTRMLMNFLTTLEQEDVKVKAIEALRKKTYEEGIAFMIKRNREKISEIWFIIKNYKDEINSMMQQVLHGDVSSVRG